MRWSVVRILAMGVIGFSGSSADAKTLRACNAEYSAHRAAIIASGQEKAAFVAACRARIATSPSAPAAQEPDAAAPPPADPMAPKPMFPMPTASPAKP